MRIAVLEDQEHEAKTLLTLLARYVRERALVADFVHFGRAQNLLDVFDSTPADLAFLDIYLDGESGMDVARQLTARHPKCKLIFATTSHTHAVESYRVRAAYYLTKPLSYEDVCEAMDTACKELMRDNRCILLHSGGIPVNVPLREIIYLDCTARQTVLHLPERALSVDEPVGEVLERLRSDDRFLLCNRNLAVNMDYISELREADCLLQDGGRLPLRAKGRRELREAYLSYRVGFLQQEGQS